MKVFDGFMETGFERRFQAMIMQAQQRHSWHVIAAEPGSGKSLGILDLVHQSGAEKRRDGTTIVPLLAVKAPENDTKETSLAAHMVNCFGRVPAMRWADRKLWLVAEMARTKVDCLVIDDAHFLSLQQLAFLQEVTDLLRQAPYERRIGLCLVVAALGDHIPLRDVFARQDELWVQFRRRLDAHRPYVRIMGHSQQEVLEVLVTFEQIYRDQFPTLNLGRWSSACYAWLTHPVLDPQGSQRVVMDHLVKVIVLALEASLKQGLTDVSETALRQAAEQLTLRRDDVTILDDVQENDLSSSPMEQPRDDEQRDGREEAS